MDGETWQGAGFEIFSDFNADFEETNLLGTIKSTFDAEEELDFSTSGKTQGSGKKCFLKFFCASGSAGATAFGKITGDASISSDSKFDF